MKRAAWKEVGLRRLVPHREARYSDDHLAKPLVYAIMEPSPFA